MICGLLEHNMQVFGVQQYTVGKVCPVDLNPRLFNRTQRPMPPSPGCKRVDKDEMLTIFPIRSWAEESGTVECRMKPACGAGQLGHE